MKINIIAIGTRMPEWVNQATQIYSRRMPADYELSLTEIAAVKRDKHTDINAALIKESDALFAKCQPHHITIALDRLGQQISTQQLATQLQDWHDSSDDIALLIGGPEGIHADHLKRATKVWSLSKMTLAHPFVRVMIAEQLYRAYTIAVGHPYHR